MIKTSVEKLAEEIGFDIGTSDDVTQAKLLNGFCKGLANSMDQHQMEKQICAITDSLSDKSCRVIKEFAEFIKLREQ